MSKLSDLPPPPEDYEPIAYEYFKHTNVYEITPEMAQAMLDDVVQFFRNRPISQPSIRLYASKMRQGRWVINGETMVICEKGFVMNGHHRLIACTRADVSFKTLVVLACDFGITRKEAFPTFDTGRSRPNSHVLAIAGYRKPTKLAQALSWLDMLMEWKLNKKTSPSQDEILEMAREYSDMEEIVQQVFTRRFVALCASPAHFAGLHYVLMHLVEYQYRELAKEFLDGIITGTGLEKGDPRLALRDKWAQFKAAKKARAGRQDRLHPLVFSIRAWNAWARRKKITSLRVNKDGSVPRILGWDHPAWKGDSDE